MGFVLETYHMANHLSTQSYYPVSVPSTGRRRTYGDPQVGRRLETFRKLKGLKQEALAAIWGTDRNVVGAYETGRRRLQIDKAKTLAERYKDLDLTWLITGKGAPPGSELSEELATKVADLERRLQNLEASQGALTRVEDQLERMRDAMGSPDKPRIQTDQ